MKLSAKDRLVSDFRTVLTPVVFMVFVVGYNMLIGADGMSRIDAIGAYTKWTPFGAGAGAIEAFAVGLWGEAGLLTLLAFVYVAAGFWLWSQLINRALTAPLDQGGQGQSAKDSAGEGKKVLFLPGNSLVSWRCHFLEVAALYVQGLQVVGINDCVPASWRAVYFPELHR